MKKTTLTLYLLFVTLLGVLWSGFSQIQKPSDGLHTDFYPIYRAAQTALQSESPYSEEEQEHYRDVWKVPFAHVGFAYPLPASLGFLPLMLLPLSLAGIVWNLMGIIGVVLLAPLKDDWRYALLLLLLFMPLHRAILYKQATLIWFGIILFLIICMKKDWPLAVGWCIAMLPAKPQTGLFFALAGIYWGFRCNKKAVGWAGLWILLIWGGSFAFVPGWVQEWLRSVALYQEQVKPLNLIPWSLFIILATWKMPWYATLAAAQVALFPTTDVYNALPLLLGWAAVGGPLSLLGASLSWVGVLINLPNSGYFYVVFVLIPFVCCSGLRQYQYLRKYYDFTSQESLQKFIIQPG